MKFTLDLEEAEVNLIIQTLAQAPFAQVFQLIPKIQLQCQEQMKPAQDA